MKAHLKLIAAAAFLILPGSALAQTDEHHPDADALIVASTAPAPMAGGLPEQCMAMMPMMQQMMQMMMQGGMMQGMPMGGAGMSDASQAYMNAMRMMDGPMMQGAQAAIRTSRSSGHDPASPGRDRHGSGRPQVRKGRTRQGMGQSDHRGAGSGNRCDAGLAEAALAVVRPLARGEMPCPTKRTRLCR